MFGLLADAPARAQSAGVLGHTATYGCAKCTTEGRLVATEGEVRGRMTYPDINRPLRTDASFRARSQRRHHRDEGAYRSVMEDLPNFDMVRGIANDPMHLFDIGLMKKILVWMKVGKETDARLSRDQVSVTINYVILIISCNNTE